MHRVSTACYDIKLVTKDVRSKITNITVLTKNPGVQRRKILRLYINLLFMGHYKFSITTYGFTVIVSLALACSIPLKSTAQSPFTRFANLFTEPKSYVVNYTKTDPVI